MLDSDCDDVPSFRGVRSHAVRLRPVRGGYAEEPEDAQTHASQKLPVHQYALVSWLIH